MTAAAAASGSRLSVTRVDVGEHRPRALVERRVGRGDERERARDDLVAVLHARPRAAPGAARPCRCDTALACGAPTRAANGLLELRHARAERELPGAQHLDHGALLRLAEHRPGERDRLARPLRPARREPAGRWPSCDRRRVAAVAPAARPGCIPYSSESTSASQEAAIRFSETPIEPHTSCPSEASISTRVTAPVPFVSSRMRTLKLTSSMSRRCGWISPIASRSALVERVHRAVALGGAHVALAADPDLDRRLGLDLAVGALLDDHAPGLQAEQRLVLARLLAHQQLERAVGGLELEALVLELLDALDDALRERVAVLAAGGPTPARRPSRRSSPLPESSEMSTSRRLPTTAGSTCSKVCASARTPAACRPALCAKACLPT